VELEVARREPWPLDLTIFNAIFYLFSSTDVAVGQLGISELQERILFYHSICYTHIGDAAAPTLSRSCTQRWCGHSSCQRVAA
jgi:hypothetical protein